MGLPWRIRSGAGWIGVCPSKPRPDCNDCLGTGFAGFWVLHEPGREPCSCVGPKLRIRHPRVRPPWRLHTTYLRRGGRVIKTWRELYPSPRPGCTQCGGEGYIRYVVSPGDCESADCPTCMDRVLRWRVPGWFSPPPSDGRCGWPPVWED